MDAGASASARTGSDTDTPRPEQSWISSPGQHVRLADQSSDGEYKINNSFARKRLADVVRHVHELQASAGPSAGQRARASFRRLAFRVSEWAKLKVDRLPPIASESNYMRTRPGVEENEQEKVNISMQEAMSRMRLFITLQCVIAFFNIGLTVALLEVRYRTSFADRGDFPCNMIKLANSVLTFGLLGATAGYYYSRIKFMVFLNNLPQGTSLSESGMLQRFIIECIVMAIHVPPFIHLDPEHGFYYEGLISALTVPRCYLFIRLLYLRSDLFTPHGRFVASLTHCKMNSLLAFKIALKARPLRILLTLFGLTIITCTYLTWIFERWMPAASFDEENVLADFWTCLYLTLITVYTVGYGDLTPKTPLGRAVAVIECALGGVLTATLIAVVTQELTLNSSEQLVMSYLEKAKYKAARRAHAAVIVQRAWRGFVKRRLLQREAKAPLVPGETIAADVCVKIRDLRKLRQLGRQLNLEGRAMPVDIAVSAVRAEVAILAGKVDKLLQWAARKDLQEAAAAPTPAPPSPPPRPTSRPHLHSNSPGTPAAAVVMRTVSPPAE